MLGVTGPTGPVSFLVSVEACCSKSNPINSSQRAGLFQVVAYLSCIKRRSKE